ncbi:phage tail tape measure protein, partial [Salmonella enterica subsp. enterica serovar Minnesota]|nr:phage tail tape measure protein [Salmonella enterica subsp. enterica serovar Minnesota]
MDKDLRLQVILGAVNKMTAPMKAAQNSNRKLAQAIQSTKKNIRVLDEQSGKIAGFRKNKQALTQLSGEMRAAQARVKALALAIRQGGKDTAALTKEQKKATEAARK